MQKHVCSELVDMEIICKKKVQTSQRLQVYPHTFQHPCRYKCQDVDDQQILGYYRQITHFACILYSMLDLFAGTALSAGKITKNIRQIAENKAHTG